MDFEIIDCRCRTFSSPQELVGQTFKQHMVIISGRRDILIIGTKISEKSTEVNTKVGNEHTEVILKL